MGAMSLKEKAVLAIVGVAVVYIATIGWWILGSSGRDAAKSRLEKEISKVKDEKKTISERNHWEALYEEEASFIPVIAEDQGSDTVWMSTIGDIAQTNNVSITELRPGKEDSEDWGDMKKTTVDIKWVGAVESLVKFMYELENTDKGKFDVQSLNFSQRSRSPGFMSGNMTIVCIFKRPED